MIQAPVALPFRSLRKGFLTSKECKFCANEKGFQKLTF
jgi:hypothetical protein